MKISLQRIFKKILQDVFPKKPFGDQLSLRKLHVLKICPTENSLIRFGLLWFFSKLIYGKLFSKHDKQKEATLFLHRVCQLTEFSLLNQATGKKR